MYGSAWKNKFYAQFKITDVTVPAGTGTVAKSQSYNRKRVLTVLYCTYTVRTVLYIQYSTRRRFFSSKGDLYCPLYSTSFPFLSPSFAIGRSNASLSCENINGYKRPMLAQLVITEVLGHDGGYFSRATTTKNGTTIHHAENTLPRARPRQQSHAGRGSSSDFANPHICYR
jgi:hypothetical protein